MVAKTTRECYCLFRTSSLPVRQWLITIRFEVFTVHRLGGRTGVFLVVVCWLQCCSVRRVVNTSCGGFALMLMISASLNYLLIISILLNRTGQFVVYIRVNKC